jgi:hypothetical protein
MNMVLVAEKHWNKKFRPGVLALANLGQRQVHRSKTHIN